MSRRAILFARVSTDDRGQDTESQLMALRTIAARFGWQIVAELPLEVSAWSERTAADVRRQALAAVRHHRADVLAVWALDRVCRAGIAEAFALLNELEKHLGAAFYSYQEPFLSTATADPGMRSLLLALFAWMAQQESSRKSERVKARVENKRQRGAAIGQRGKWGRGYLPTEADVARVRALAAAGKSLRAIEAETGGQSIVRGAHHCRRARGQGGRIAHRGRGATRRVVGTPRASGANGGDPGRARAIVGGRMTPPFRAGVPIERPGRPPRPTGDWPRGPMTIGTVAGRSPCRHRAGSRPPSRRLGAGYRASGCNLQLPNLHTGRPAQRSVLPIQAPAAR